MSEPLREAASGGGVPERIGPYRVLELIGHGGMGVVYLAQRDNLPGRVAIKLIKLGMDTREVLARFEVERRALSLMDHSHIARVLDAGVSETGQPYFVMEHVPGLPLMEYCDRQKLSVADRLALFLRVCDAVTHAHQKGVIHRDLTPRNILVKEENDKPVPKVIDFGLARAVDHSGLTETVFTQRGIMLGTPEYMSPEQAGMTPFDIDARTDVYSLGVILYELLVGELPLDRKALREAGLLEMQRCIREQEPIPPSVRMERNPASDAHARDRATTTQGLRRLVGQDLDWVTLKALEKDRRRRYPTVQNLADEVTRYLRSEPVQAGPPGVGYRLRKWTVRHRVGVVSGALVLSCLLAGLGLSIAAWREAEAARSELTLVGDLMRARELIEQAEDLWPEHGRRLPAFEAWLQRARGVESRMAETRRRLTEHRAVAAFLPPGADMAARLLRANTLAALDQNERDLSRLGGDWGLIAVVQARRDRVVQGLGGGASWTPDPADMDLRWRQLTEDLRSEAAFAGISLDSIKVDWLYPLGRDRSSGLQEALVLGTGGVPRRNENGSVFLQPEDGIVMVLLPPGQCWIGCQSTAPQAPGYLRQEIPGSGVLEAVSSQYGADGKAVSVLLDAFWLGKFEVTQAQWLRIAGENWSQFRADGAQDRSRHSRPVENISHVNAIRVLRHVGLELPTEGQWEYACRAGASGAWPWGDDVKQMAQHANLADLAAQAQGVTWPELAAAAALGINDGVAETAPVGSYAANRFGLYDMLGNVAEWTVGGFTNSYSAGFRNGNGLVIQPAGDSPEGVAQQVLRGGSYRAALEKTTPAARVPAHRHNRHPTYGVRPALPLSP